MPADVKLDSKIPSELREDFGDVLFLGHGGQGLTFRATRKSDQKLVALKVLDFLELSSWKSYDLFLREIAILKTLDHPAIPKVLGVFPATTDDAEPEAVVLIQEYFEGESLKDLLDASDEPWSEKEVIAFLEEMLPILSYLHALNPPVVHRDIKPSNIIRRPDGTFALIDFGAASATQRTNASTFVGTNGYMALEQMMGRAEPRSDLYSLGATALHLATGIHPNMLSREDFSFRLDGLGLDPKFTRLIERFVHPLFEKRFRNAHLAQQNLQPSHALMLAELSEKGFKMVRQHEGTRIDFLSTPRHVRWRIWPVILMTIPIPILAVLAMVLDPMSLWQHIFFSFFGGMGALLGVVCVFLLFRNRHIVVDHHSIRYVERLGPYSHEKTWPLAEGPEAVLKEVFLRPFGLGMLALSTEQQNWLTEKLPLEIEEYQ